MTRIMRSCRKAKVYVQSGQHAKAAHWLIRTLEILDGDQALRRRSRYMDTDYLLAALFVLVVVGLPRAKQRRICANWRNDGAEAANCGQVVSGRSAVPSITFAASPARAASISRNASRAASSSSSVSADSPPKCSAFISFGTSKAQIVTYSAGWFFATLSMTFGPSRRKWSASASRNALKCGAYAGLPQPFVYAARQNDSRDRQHNERVIPGLARHHRISLHDVRRRGHAGPSHHSFRLYASCEIVACDTS